LEHASPSFTFAIALGVGVTAQLIARHLRIPSIVLLLAAGVAVGPDGLQLVLPRDLGAGLFPLVALAVAVILFEGGLNLDLQRVRHAGTPVRRLISLGALITTVGGGLAAHLIMEWPVGLSILFGTLVIVTGPTVIKPLLRNVPMSPRLSTVLEAEGLLIDPVGAIVAAVTLQVVLAPTVDSFASGALGVITRLGFGLGAGGIAGLALVGLLRVPRAVPEGLENLVALGTALVTFEVCESVLTESGILAVVVAGVVVGNLDKRVRRELGEFQEHLTVGLIGILFVLLAADVRVADVIGLGWPGLATVGALALIVRPVGVWASTAGAGFSLREKAFLSWTAPRGVVAAAIATLAAGFMDEFGVEGGGEIRALVFLTIAVTVLVQGGTAPLVASLLGVRAPGRDGIVILGAEELGFALAEVLKETTERIAFSDINPRHCRAAEERGYNVIYGNALEQRTVARMRLERAWAVVGATANSQVNIHFAGEAADDYGVRNTYVAVEREGGEASERIVKKQAGRVLFDRPKDVERWHVRLRHGAAEICRLRFAGASETPENGSDDSARRLAGTVDPYLVLAVRRDEDRWEPMFQQFEPRAGDRAAAVLYAPEREEALATLRTLGWELESPEAVEAEAQPAGNGEKDLLGP